MKRSLAFILSFTAAASLASAQTPRPVIPGLNNDPDAAPAVNPNLGNATGELDPDDIAYPASGEGIQLPKATGLDIAGLIWDHSRKRVILTKAASETEVFFVQRGPMTHREVMKLLKASLLLEGLAIIPDPLDPTIVRLLPSGPVTGTTGQALPYIDDPLDLPEEDQLVTYRMQFNSLNPDDALRIFQSVVGQFGPSGRISAVANASSVIITENSALIRQLLKIKEDIDKGSLVEDRWVHITYADVEEISQQLNEIYNQQRGGSGGGSATRTRRTTGTPAVPGLPGGARARSGNAGGEPSGEDIPVNIIPDARTSRLLIIGRPSDLDAVEKLIRSYDVPSDPKTQFRYQLRYLRVGDFIPIATQAIERTLGNQASGGGSANGGRSGGSNNRNQTGRNQNNNRNNNNGGQQGGGGGGSRGGGSIQAQDVPTEPTAESVGRTLLVADNVANAVIVNGPPHHIEIVRNLITELDTAGQQIVISAVIGSYEIDDDLNFGIDLARIVQDTGRSLDIGGQTLFGTPGVIDPGTLNTLAGLLGARGNSGSGVSLYGTIGEDFGVFVNALESTNKFKTLQRPVITTRNNRVATITSGDRIAVPSSTFAGGAANGTTTNVEFRDVVLELEIQPLINANNEVTLEIALVRDALGTNRTVGELVIPDISTETLNTSVTVPNGAAIILGGLILEEDRNGKNGVPILSRVPGLGRLFSRSTNDKNRSELVILLRPEIINGSSDLNNFRRSFEGDAPIARDARKSLPPTSAGMLPPNGRISALEPTSKSGVSLKTSSDRNVKKKKSSWLKPTSSKKKHRRPGGRRRR